MVTEMTIYWMTRLDAIVGVSTVISILLAISGVCGILIGFVEEENDWIKISSIAVLVSVFFGTIAFSPQPQNSTQPSNLSR